MNALNYLALEVAGPKEGGAKEGGAKEGGAKEGGVGEGGVGEGSTPTEVPNCQVGARRSKFRFSCVALIRVLKTLRIFLSQIFSQNVVSRLVIPLKVHSYRHL